MKKILSLILTLLVSLTGMTCLVYAGDYGYTDLDFTGLTDIEVVEKEERDYGYQILLKPTNGKVMPNSIKIQVNGETKPLDQCIATNKPDGCSYTYHRETKDKNSTLLIYKKNSKDKKIFITAEGKDYTGEVNYTILDNGTSVKNLFYNVGDGDYVIHDTDGNYTNTFGIAETHIRGRNYENFGMYQLPAGIEVKIGDSTSSLKKCSEGETLGTNCDYTYNNNYSPYSDTIFASYQRGELVIAEKCIEAEKTIKVTINLNKLERNVTGNIKNGYFNNDTSMTGDNVKLDTACKADGGYTAYINAYSNYELPDTIKVSGLTRTTDPRTWITFTDGVEYNYDKNTGKVTFNSNIFDYNEEFKIEVENTYKEEEKKASIVTCEDANGKGWIWSESKKACVYKVSNTSTKG